MHFCVSATRGESAFFCPRKIGTNWFMPAFVNKRFGESGMSELDGTMVCDFDLKKSRNDWRICVLVIMAKLFSRLAAIQRVRRVGILCPKKRGFMMSFENNEG